MGKEVQKHIIDVACPNKNCKLCGLTDQGNVTGNGTYISRGEKTRRYHAMNAAKYFATIRALFIMIFAKTRKLSN